jgi:DMSO/TMAO reductase YedYZ molybdopterin-dependent catalytic subunit
MNRRAFIHSTLFAAAWATHRGAAAGQPDRHSGKWIIPTNTPDRFGLKVMAFNPIRVPDPAAYRLAIGGLVEEPLVLTTADLDRLVHVKQNSRLKCVQCWSGRVDWEGFRAQALLGLTRLKPEAGWVRVDCADKYYDFVKLDDLLHARTLFATAMQGEALTPQHGSPLRLVLPHKYGYKSSKLITSLTFLDKGGRGLQADGMPYYSETGDILPGVDHPFEFPDEVRKIPGGEITEY